MTRLRPFWFSTLFAGLWLALAAPALALWAEDEPLAADKAFDFSAEMTAADRLNIHWDVTDGYYLYRSRIQIRSDTPGITLGTAEFPPGKLKHDAFFGEVETYRGGVDISVPITRTASAPDRFRLIALSQGCADQGICYPPHTQTAELTLPARTDAAPATSAPVDLNRALGLDSGDNEFLPVERAFRPSVSANTDGTALLARWDVQDGYYLYRDKLRVELDSGNGVTLQAAQFPAGDIKDDETFGRVEVYHGPIEVRVPLARTDSAATTLGIKLSYQGCAEGLICYPPVTQSFDVALPASTTGMPADSASRPDSDASNKAASTTPPLSEQDQIARVLTDKPLWFAILIFFGLGLGLSVTPCVFPMIPILSTIIVGQGEHITTRRAFTLSLIYVMAMALTYTAAGVIAALFGENLQAAFQNPWILSGFAAVFVLLALSMFGFYDLQMPAALQSRLSSLSNRQRGGTLIGVAVMGLLSALIVGPCVAAPLAAALLVIGQTGDTVLGGAALFALSMGMGAPLLAIGTGAGKLLPRAGGWMNNVKAVFGVLLLAVAIWMLERILPTTASMALWAALLITSAVYMGALERLDIDATGWHKLWKGTGLILLVYGALVLTGIASGGKDVVQPLRGTAFTADAATATSPKLEFRRIKSLADLDREVAQANAQGKSVMLDFFAEWCTECHRLEKNTFSDATVQTALNNTIALQADVTANDAVDKALMQRYKLIGPPAILFFDTTGQELNSHRVVGYMDAEGFAARVRSTVGPGN